MKESEAQLAAQLAEARRREDALADIYRSYASKHQLRRVNRFDDMVFTGYDPEEEACLWKAYKDAQKTRRDAEQALQEGR